MNKGKERYRMGKPRCKTTKQKHQKNTAKEKHSAKL